ncbi:MAG: transcription antitermination factor NusB [Bacillota bacterium]
MGRRQARETAMKSLYQVDVGGAEPESAITNAMDMDQLSPEDIDFARELVMGSIEHMQEIDKTISSLSKDWNIDRLARVDHNIMRMAVYEIMYRDDIPYGVTVNEAVELAKMYGGSDSGKFVNGILGKVAGKAALSGTGAGSEGNL